MASDAEKSVRAYALPLAIVASVLLTFFAPMGVWVDQLFVTFLHESSHGIAAILTGGTLVRFEVHPDMSGVAWTSGGIRPIITASGYIGACLWGGALLVAARRPGWEKAVCGALAVFFLGFTLFYTRNLFGVLVGLGYAGFFAMVAWRGYGWQLALLLNFLAVRSVLNSLDNIRDLLYYARVPNAPLTDAQILSTYLTHGLVPAMVFAVGIATLSIVALGGFLWTAWRVERRFDRIPARE